MLMLYKGNEPDFVAECLGIDVSMVYRYIVAHRGGVVDELLEKTLQGMVGAAWRLSNSGVC